MSAFLVPREHIAFLIEAALSKRLGGHRQLGFFDYYHGDRMKRLDRENLEEVGQMLWDANRESLLARYPQDPDFARRFVYEHSATDVALLERVSWASGSDLAPCVLKAISCFEYQACEFGGWESSEAFAFCGWLRKAACGAVIGYDGAITWPLTAEKLAEFERKVREGEASHLKRVK